MSNRKKIEHAAREIASKVLGNGVVEATAALAFTTLDERFIRS